MTFFQDKKYHALALNFKKLKGYALKKKSDIIQINAFQSTKNKKLMTFLFSKWLEEYDFLNRETRTLKLITEKHNKFLEEKYLKRWRRWIDKNKKNKLKIYNINRHILIKYKKVSFTALMNYANLQYKLRQSFSTLSAQNGLNILGNHFYDWIWAFNANRNLTKFRKKTLIKHLWNYLNKIRDYNKQFNDHATYLLFTREKVMLRHTFKSLKNAVNKQKYTRGLLERYLKIKQFQKLISLFTLLKGYWSIRKSRRDRFENFRADKRHKLKSIYFARFRYWMTFKKILNEKASKLGNSTTLQIKYKFLHMWHTCFKTSRYHYKIKNLFVKK